jgi:hypothetical protein
MNTGIQDAHNLAWKLAAALGKGASSRSQSRLADAVPVTLKRSPREGSIPDEDISRRQWMQEVLASYEGERRPIAISNTALSIENWKETLSVRAAIL